MIDIEELKKIYFVNKISEKHTVIETLDRLVLVVHISPETDQIFGANLRRLTLDSINDSRRVMNIYSNDKTFVLNNDLLSEYNLVNENFDKSNVVSIGRPTFTAAF